MPEQGDIVLIPVPFTDLSSQKRRPVIVISNNSYNQRTADMIVVAMTSNQPQQNMASALHPLIWKGAASITQAKSEPTKSIPSRNQ